MGRLMQKCIILGRFNKINSFFEKTRKKFPKILRNPPIPRRGRPPGATFSRKIGKQFLKKRENRLGFFENRAIIIAQMTLCCGVRADTGTGGGDAAVPRRRVIDHLAVLI
jgi:hypothetical protein